jgi:hypothetical protein
MGSEMVKAVRSKSEAYTWAGKIRQFFDKPEFIHATEQSIVVDGERFNLYNDVLVEEQLDGAEYTLDGYLTETGIEVVAQHKETIWDGTFLGDGGIFCPPDHGVTPSSPIVPLKLTGPNRTSSASFQKFANAALLNLQLTKWFLHGEISVDNCGHIRVIEINPRIPGGLLWKTAGTHLGIDPTECIVRFHLRLPLEIRRKRCVTVQFPIYAEQEGIVDHIEGLDVARALPCKPYIVEAVSHGYKIDNLTQENYAAFVCIEAPNHEAARRLEQEVRGILKVRYC